MATGRKTVVVGQVIDPVAWGNPLWDQSIQQFASDADRTAQFPVGQRKLGAVTWVDDAKRLDVWNGASWVPLPSRGPSQLRNQSTATFQGQTDADLATQAVPITLTAGWWQVEGGVSALLTAGPAGSVTCGLYNAGTSALITDSMGEGGTTTTTTLAGVRSRPLLIDATAANISVCTFTRRSPGSTVQLISIASAPSTWINATRIS